MSGSQFYEWLFGPEKSSGLSRNRPLDPEFFCLLIIVSYSRSCENICKHRHVLKNMRARKIFKGLRKQIQMRVETVKGSFTTILYRSIHIELARSKYRTQCTKGFKIRRSLLSFTRTGKNSMEIHTNCKNLEQKK